MIPSKPLRLLPAFILWATAIACGAWYALAYENTPAPNDVASATWPAESSCVLSAAKPTLVMFVHPRCPCSRASLHELALLMTHCRDRLDAQIVFVIPQSVPSEWSQTDLWGSASRIPGVRVFTDAGGIEQGRFHARASGESFVYLPSGQLLFHGGITAGRGHAGDNPGRSALEAYLLRDEWAQRTTPVFGCELGTPAVPANACHRGDD